VHAGLLVPDLQRQAGRFVSALTDGIPVLVFGLCRDLERVSEGMGEFGSGSRALSPREGDIQRHAAAEDVDAIGRPAGAAIRRPAVVAIELPGATAIDPVFATLRT
jgi:hypothetical protein